MRKLLFSAIVTALLNAAPVAAQPPNSPEALKAAEELFAILSKDILAQLSAGITAQAWPRIEAELGRTVDAATLAELRAEFDRVVHKFLTEAMKEGPPIYAKHFSAPELREVAAFYRSPTGAKALRLLPQVLLEFNTVMTTRLAGLEKELSEALDAVLRRRGKSK
jgi:hypothetical protein